MPDELLLPLTVVGLVAGWLARIRVTYRWRAAHRREATAPRHRRSPPAAAGGRWEPRTHQDDPRLDPGVERALQGLERHVD